MGGFVAGLRRRHKVVIGVAVLAVAAGLMTLPNIGSGNAYADVVPTRSTIKGGDGRDYWVDNHLVSKDITRSREALHSQGRKPEYLIVWAGDSNIADTIVPDIKNLPGSLANTVDKVKNALPGPDFLAVLDATQGSPTYGKVLNTGTVGPLVENEPHHMEYVWHKGEKVFAGGLFSAATYVFDVSKLPALSLSGISLPSQTLCGSVPDAFWVLKDGTAYGTYMGGPVAPGPCRYTHGEVRSGNGFAGTPGEVVRFGKQGQNLDESPAATTKAEDPKQCLDTPSLSLPSCANPHGIQVREDLNTMVTADYAEPRNIILDPIKTPSPYLRRPSVRTWDISDRNHPKVKSVTILPEGPRSDPNDPTHTENRMVMEDTVTNLPGHKGAFAESMQGGAIYYAPDITAEHPAWREVFDDTEAASKFSDRPVTGAGDNGTWLQTSPDDKTLYHNAIGRPAGTLGPSDKGTVGGVFALDISKIVAAGEHPDCEIKTKSDINHGGSGEDCPTLRSALPINPGKAGAGPHWGALDNLLLGDDGYYHETKQPRRLATADYFVARTGLDGDHKVCMVNIHDDGKLTLDKAFRDENTGQPCISFNRKNWPHGAFGNAKPHSMLFVVADDDIK
jgi:hypothetical protein